MLKANLYCRIEKIFQGNLLLHKPSLPGKNDESKKEEASAIEVNVLEINGEEALVLLPNIMTQDENQTALVGIQHLNIY